MSLCPPSRLLDLDLSRLRSETYPYLERLGAQDLSQKVPNHVYTETPAAEMGLLLLLLLASHCRRRHLVHNGKRKPRKQRRRRETRQVNGFLQIGTVGHEALSAKMGIGEKARGVGARAKIQCVKAEE